jgi:hypothetical protein
VDAARQKWDIGLADAEALQYHGDEGHTEDRSEAYQKGFAAALRPEGFGQSYDTVQTYLQHHYGDIYHEPDFRRGYEQGLHYGKHIQEKWRQAVLNTSDAGGRR